MNEDQINALEQWIIAIIADERRHSDLIDARHRMEAKDEVRQAFTKEERA